MPSTSTKQARYMAMCAHRPEHARGKCPPMKVAREFNQADARAGRAAAVKKRLRAGKE